MKLASLVAFTALTCSAAGPEQSLSTSPGAYDVEVMKTLQGVNQTLPLGKTGLAKLAPELLVSKQDDLDWQAAVTAADRRFGADASASSLRAMFLRKYLKAGMPESCLDVLKLTDAGLSLRTGSSRSRSLIIGPPEKPVARMHFSIAHGSKALVAEPIVEILDHPLVNIICESASFDVEDRLTGWRMRSPRKDEANDAGEAFAGFGFRRLPYDHFVPKFWKPRQTVFEYGANLSGEDGAGHFWVRITHADGLLETLTFSDQILIKDRRVEGKSWVGMVPGQPGVQTSHDPDYRELYEKGHLHKRLHYGQRQDEHGTVSVVVKEERL